MPKTAAVIVAAGRGSRMNNDGGPKQYRLLAGKAILHHSVNAFTNHPDIDAVIVVIHADDGALYENAVEAHDKLLSPVIGGKTRQASCRIGVEAIVSKGGFANVLIHDAARPFVSPRVISAVISGIEKGVCALPAIALADTLKRCDDAGTVIETVPRNGLFIAQTPQGFLLNEIAKAHSDAESGSNAEFTDDAAVAEWAGAKVKCVEGDRKNFKITTPEDMQLAEEQMHMTGTIPDIRTGTGYDVHTLGPGDHVMLCGIKIPHTAALQGHSDADVGLHALTDALLGTKGLGDIGSHFPPSDAQWKGASSDRFLAHAASLIAEQGGTITNLDVTIICEAPKIGPHRDTMRQKISEIVEIDLDRVSVKATTNERIGFIGREEGIAAIASATVLYGDTGS